MLRGSIFIWKSYNSDSKNCPQTNPLNKLRRVGCFRHFTTYLPPINFTSSPSIVTSNKPPASDNDRRRFFRRLIAPSKASVIHLPFQFSITVIFQVCLHSPFVFTVSYCYRSTAPASPLVYVCFEVHLFVEFSFFVSLFFTFVEFRSMNLWIEYFFVLYRARRSFTRKAEL